MVCESYRIDGNLLLASQVGRALRPGRFLSEAYVKVVGSGDGKIRAGDTDLRGISVADALIGKATVIVRHLDEFVLRAPDVKRRGSNQAV